MIWVPKRKEIVIASQLPSVGVAGYYKLEVLNPDKTLKYATGWFPNLITNNGLDLLGQEINLMGVVAVGSGNAAPAFSDSTLQTIVAATSNLVSQTSGVQATAPYYGTGTHQWQFAQGAAAGNLAEVGVGASSTNLLSRALILDGLGNPTTITVLANEFLNVTYSLRMYVPTADVTGSVVLLGVSYNYTIRASRANTNNTNFGWAPRTQISGTFVSPGPSLLGSCIRVTDGAINAAVTGTPGGTSVQNGSPANTTYVTGAYQKLSSYTWGINDGNLGAGITAMEIQAGNYVAIGSGGITGGRGSYQIGFSAAIPKDNTKQLTLQFAHSWVRV